MLKTFGKSLTYFLDNCSIHGLRYLGTRCNVLGKLFWLVMIICSFTSMTLILLYTLESFEETVNINIETSYLRWNNTFPATSICYTKGRSLTLIKYGSLCTGYVEVFDKHWNMALSDVYESWKRRKYRYSENKLCSLGEVEDCSELLRKMGIDVPEVSVKSVDRKYQMCSRKVPKLLVRGEQVVLVTPDVEEDVGKQ